MKIKKTVITCCAVLGLAATSVFAATPTAAQIAQFQQLPRAQQQALAKQMGVDLSTLSLGGSSSTGASTSVVAKPTRTMAKAKVAAVQQIDQSTGAAVVLKPFGYEVLASGNVDFTAVDSLPVPNDYVMAPGDEVVVQLYGKTNQEYALRINREGYVNFPEYGPVTVSGQTFEQMRKQITALIEQKVIGVDVVVTMGAMRTMQIYVTGAIQQPGAYNVNGLTTITQALIASGGIKQIGSLRNIQLKRKGQVVSTLDLYDLLIKGDSSGDVRLLGGDTLFVPVKKAEVSIKGEVLRPAIYEPKGKMTVGKLLTMSGGLKPEAMLSSVNIERVTDSGTRIVTLDLSKAQDRRYQLLDGDKVDVRRVDTSLEGVITLRGEVTRQGSINYKAGMRVSDAIDSVEDDLKPNADLEFALLVRELKHGDHIAVYQISLEQIIDNPGTEVDLVLEENDQLFVFDNGVDVDYWYNQKSNSKAVAKNALQNRTAEHYDAETGAMVATKDTTELDVQGADTVSLAENLQQSSREKLLEPIIERLKAQASYSAPAKLIKVTGAVRYPGTYPLVENQTIARLVAAAGGLNEKAFTPSAEISRPQVQGNDVIIQHLMIPLGEALSGNDQGVQLKEADHLIVKTQPNWQQDMTIELQGEVMFPGTYTFQKGETLKDVVERAGGLTQYAYAQGAVFSRERLQRQEQERLRLLNVQLKQEIASLALRRQNSSATYTTSPSEAMQIADELENTNAMGRLVIDLPKVLVGDEASNIMLEKGDKLYVPLKNPTISVMGEVQYSSNQTYRPGVSVDDYIASAGGIKKQADDDRIYVVRADGSVMLPNNSYWFSRKEKPLQPGDTIIVPIDTDYLDGLSTVTSATQILYQIGVAWGAVKD